MANGQLWNQISGFFNGLTKVSESVEGLTGSAADNAENIARGQTAMWTARDDHNSAVLQMQLDRYKTLRGDNVQFYWAAAAGVALGLVLIMK